MKACYFICINLSQITLCKIGTNKKRGLYPSKFTLFGYNPLTSIPQILTLIIALHINDYSFHKNNGIYFPSLDKYFSIASTSLSPLPEILIMTILSFGRVGTNFNA